MTINTVQQLDLAVRILIEHHYHPSRVFIEFNRLYADLGVTPEDQGHNESVSDIIDFGWKFDRPRSGKTSALWYQEL